MTDAPHRQRPPSGPVLPARPELSDGAFDGIRGLLRDKTGIAVSETKRHLVSRRLASRLRELDCETYADYLALLETGDAGELQAFTNAMTTNQTSFFRERHHFEYLADSLLPQLDREKRQGRRRLRLWSAGCSTGEEAYSIAMTLREHLPAIDSWDARILCTDIDSSVIAHAREGRYSERQVESVPDALRNRWLDRDGDTWVVREGLRALTVFKQLNLLQGWPMRGPFDAVFCRNVFIYFERATQLRLVDRIAELLDDGGYLFLGHSESVINASERFRLVGKTIYRKVR